VEISRTGYTGDLGYEIWVDRDHALGVWDAIMAAGSRHGIVPAGLSALDVARIEAGFILFGVDYVSAHQALVASQTSSPFEVGLGWTVHLNGGAFVGKRALEAEKAGGSAWQFVGVELDWESLERAHLEFGLRPSLPIQAWRTSHPLYARGRQVGYATSGCWSPLLKRYITLAHVGTRWSPPGTELEIELTIEHRRRRVLARVAERPFYDPERKRA
jgi:aminomethyltransferase